MHELKSFPEAAAKYQEILTILSQFSRPKKGG